VVTYTLSRYNIDSNRSAKLPDKVAVLLSQGSRACSEVPRGSLKTLFICGRLCDIPSPAMEKMIQRTGIARIRRS